MIQRLQSIFFLLAAGVFGAMFKVPMATSDTATAQFLSDKVYNVTDHPVLMVLSGLGALLALITIFLFRRRKLQLKLGYVLIALAILLPLSAFLLFTGESAQMAQSVQVRDQFGMFLPAVAILFAAMANYYVKKDDHLVKSMDRLR